MESLGIAARLWLAFSLPWRVLFDGRFAARVQSPMPPTALPSTPATPTGQAPEPTDAAPDVTAALQLLAILQREGRFIDFVRDAIAAASDAEVGAAARVVHEGCARALQQYFDIAPVRTETEGSTLELSVGYDAARVRLTGNVTGDPPFRGQLVHHGWRTQAVRLPRLSQGHDPTILAPAEVEITQAGRKA